MLKRFEFAGAGCRLSALDNGNLGAPAMVLLHGMRDHAIGMERVAQAFTGYRVIAMDLRGHGGSDHSDSYTLVQLMADLRALLAHFAFERIVLVGHSLGGQVSWAFSAIYPELVDRLVLIDGLGPPTLLESRSPPLQQERWRAQVDALINIAPSRRSMDDVAQATERLLRNHPNLDPIWASRLADAGVESHPAGGVRWKWDPRAGMIFTSFMGQDAEHFYALIDCPVLIINGEHALDYWARNEPGLRDEQAGFAAANERRRQLFMNAEHVVIPGAGHMINYDQPDLLNTAIRHFLDKNG